MYDGSKIDISLSKQAKGVFHEEEDEYEEKHVMATLKYGVEQVMKLAPFVFKWPWNLVRLFEKFLLTKKTKKKLVDSKV